MKYSRPSVSLVRTQNIYRAASPLLYHKRLLAGYKIYIYIYILGGNGRLFLELERFGLQSFTFVLLVKPYTTDVISKQLSQRHTQFKAYKVQGYYNLANGHLKIFAVGKWTEISFVRYTPIDFRDTN